MANTINMIMKSNTKGTLAICRTSICLLFEMAHTINMLMKADPSHFFPLIRKEHDDAFGFIKEMCECELVFDELKDQQAQISPEFLKINWKG